MCGTRPSPSVSGLERPPPTWFVGRSQCPITLLGPTWQHLTSTDSHSHQPKTPRISRYLTTVDATPASAHRLSVSLPPKVPTYTFSVLSSQWSTAYPHLMIVGFTVAGLYIKPPTSHGLAAVLLAQGRSRPPCLASDMLIAAGPTGDPVSSSHLHLLGASIPLFIYI